MDERPTHLDLFSGIGGFALAAQWAGFRTIGFCEIDKYCQKVLAKNFRAVLADTRCECLPTGRETRDLACEKGASETDSKQREWLWNAFGNGCPIISDIRDLNGIHFAGISLLTGGFPCQPFSVAGKRRGAADDRHLWPEMLRVIKEARPAWVLGENVPGIIPMELDNVLSDLERIGYACRPFVIPACAVDARHRRDRLWVVAYSKSEYGGGISNNANSSEYQESTGQPGRDGLRESLSNTSEQGLERQREITSGTGTELNDAGDYCRWLPEPDVGRVAHGIPSRVDRLRGLGNAIVPQVAYEILKEIRKLI